MLQPNTEFKNYKTRKYFSALNGLRFISILAVLWHHTTDYHDGILGLGYLGVDLFFIISGFLITTLLLREREKTGKISIYNFYMRRSLRIFPIYYLTIIFVFFYLNFVNSDPSQNGLIPYYVFYLSNFLTEHAQNLDITWSLATEEQYYLIWPVLLILFRNRIVWVILIALFVLCQLINYGVFDNVIAGLYGLQKLPSMAILETTFAPIILGSAIALLLHHERSFAIFHFATKANWFAPLIGSLLIAIFMILPADISGTPRVIIHLLMTAFLLALVLKEDQTLVSVLKWQPIDYIGKISYGIYIYHMLVLHVLRIVFEKIDLQSPILFFIVGSSVTILVAALSYKFIETPLLDLKKAFHADTDLKSQTSLKPVE